MNIGIGAPGYMSNFLGFGCGGIVISSQSKPDYDNWGPDCAWSANDWILWHQKLVEANGKANADNIWATAYDQSSWGSKEISYSTGNDAFKEYVKANGLVPKSTILTKVYRAEGKIDAVGAPVRNLGSAITNLTQAAATTTESADTLAKWFPWIVLAGAILIGALVWSKKSLNIVA